MACGIPVIASKIWGLGEYVNEKNGIPIEQGDEAKLPDHVLRLFKDPALRERLGEGGKKFVSNFSLERIAETWEDIYNKTIQRYTKNHEA
jgi:glycosyltransferase involved in cell wall biosynthesis